jgi:uncharacterized protein
VIILAYFHARFVSIRLLGHDQMNTGILSRYTQPFALTPLQPNQRTSIVDILRGWALLGVVIMNYMEFARFDNSFPLPPPANASGMITYTLLDLVFESKSWTLLSVLFGYGFAVLIGNLQMKGYNPLSFFTRRMFWLFILALINSCFFFGDILKDYAVMGLVFLLFYRSSGRFAFISALVIIFIYPFFVPLLRFIPSDVVNSFSKLLPLFHSKNMLDVMSFNLQGTYVRQIREPFYAIICHLVILACMLLGFAAYRFSIFTRLAAHRKYIIRTFWYSLLFSILMQVLFAATRHFHWGYTKYYYPYFMPALSTMIFIVSAICWLFISGKLRWLFKPLQYVGRMTLTNYMVQNVISFFYFSGAGFGVYNTWPPAVMVCFAITIYMLQVIYSRWWLRRYNYGPVEWIWRQLSYQRRLPLKRASNA